MSLRINHNVAAVKAHRNLVHNGVKLGRTLERLSSGMRVSRASHGPATLVASEQMRAQIAGLTQAVMNSETAVAMVQTAEASLAELSRLLISIRQLAIHAANEGVNNGTMLEADQAELANALDTIDRISESARFGTKHLLDGSLGVGGVASGTDLRFVSALADTANSPPGGYTVEVTGEATRAQLVGSRALGQKEIDRGETIVLREGAGSLRYHTQPGSTPEEVRDALNAGLKRTGMKLEVRLDEKGRLKVLHRDYGSEGSFSVSSSTAGILSDRADVPLLVRNGLNIQGSIGGERAEGEGQFLVGGYGTRVRGLKVHYTGVADPLAPEVGRVLVGSEAPVFQIGGDRNQLVKVPIPDVSSRRLARGVANASRFESLRELDVRTMQGAQDAILLTDMAVEEISRLRAELGAVQKNTLESNISSLAVARENLIESESVLRDADMAAETSEQARYQILSQSAAAMLAQANQMPNNVLRLIQE